MTDRFRIYGHRGSPKRFPENTVASFEDALRAGADGFETDLRLLSCGTPVLYHDDDLGDAEIESLTLSQCSERGASIDRVSELARFAGRATMILEVKRARWEDVLLEQVAQWPDIVIASFDHSLIASLHARRVSMPLGITFFGAIAGVASYAESLGATWCFPNYRYVDEAMVSSCRARDIRVVPWTVNRARDWDRLREIGCYGVITDYPEQAVLHTKP